MNKTAIISGSSRGIGAAIAEELAKKGWNVVLNYVRNGQKAEELKDKIEKIASTFAAGLVIFCLTSFAFVLLTER